jgi:tRNA-splicing ligase RtcB (3'-phosphate/5'-hydroxy nucleic acid ligase)
MEVMMSEPSLAPIQAWLTAPMKHDVSEAIDRLRRASDVQQIAVMPDVHLATDVCIGVVVATSRLILPQAVGGDIGCGMLAVGFDVEAAALQDPGPAGRVLAGLGRAVPASRRNRRAAITPPADLEMVLLSHPSLDAMRRNEGAIEFATLSGKHRPTKSRACSSERFVEVRHTPAGRRSECLDRCSPFHRDRRPCAAPLPPSC